MPGEQKSAQPEFTKEDFYGFCNGFLEKYPDASVLEMIQEVIN